MTLRDSVDRRLLDGSGASEAHADELLDAVDSLLGLFGKIVPTPEGGMAYKLTNKTGSVSVKGTLVQIGDTDMSFKASPADAHDVIGAVYESGIPDGEECWVCCYGIVEVLLKNSTASTVGNWVTASDTIGRADATLADPPGGGIVEADEHFREIGHALESKSAGTDVLCKIIMHFN